MNDEDLYLEATNEVEGENKSPSLWAKVMALSEGDEAKAKYKYIKLRVEQLANERKNALPKFTKKTVNEFDLKYMPVAEFSKIKAIPEDKVVKMIRDGFYMGQIKNDAWYVSREETQNLNQAPNIPKQKSKVLSTEKEYIPVEEFAEFKGITPEKAIQMIRDGFYQGRIIDGKWYVSYSEISESHVDDDLEDTAHGYGAKAIILRIISIILVLWGISLALDTLFATWILSKEIAFIRLIISCLMVIVGIKIWKSSRLRKSRHNA